MCGEGAWGHDTGQQHCDFASRVLCRDMASPTETSTRPPGSELGGTSLMTPLPTGPHGNTGKLTGHASEGLACQAWEEGWGCLTRG